MHGKAIGIQSRRKDALHAHCKAWSPVYCVHSSPLTFNVQVHFIKPDEFPSVIGSLAEESRANGGQLHFFLIICLQTSARAQE